MFCQTIKKKTWKSYSTRREREKKEYKAKQFEPIRSKLNIENSPIGSNDS